MKNLLSGTGPNLIFRKAKQARKSVEKYAAKKIQIPEITGEALFGVNSSLEALKAEKREIFRVFVKNGLEQKMAKDDRILEIFKRVEKLGIVPEALTSDQLDRLTEYQLHNGICMEVSALNFTTYTPKTVSIFVDQVLDPGNLGAIARSAWFFGADGISYAKSRGPKSITPSMSKSSCGAVEHLPIQRVSTFEQYREMIKLAGGEIVATCDATSAKQQNLKLSKLEEWTRPQNPIGLVLGHEGTGIRPEILRLCDRIVTIESPRLEMSNVTSLNVSVVAGILLNHVARWK